MDQNILFCPQQEHLTFPVAHLLDWIMAQTNSSGQGTNGVADESPNMIVYRKVKQRLFIVCTCMCGFVSVSVCVSLASIYLTMSCAMQIANPNGKTVFLCYGWFRLLMLHQFDDRVKRTCIFSVKTCVTCSVDSAHKHDRTHSHTQTVRQTDMRAGVFQ